MSATVAAPNIKITPEMIEAALDVVLYRQGMTDDTIDDLRETQRLALIAAFEVAQIALS